MILEDYRSSLGGEKSRVFFRQHLPENCIGRCSKGRLFVACANSCVQCERATAGGIPRSPCPGFGACFRSRAVTGTEGDLPGVRSTRRRRNPPTNDNLEVQNEDGEKSSPRLRSGCGCGCRGAGRRSSRQGQAGPVREDLHALWRRVLLHPRLRHLHQVRGYIRADYNFNGRTPHVHTAANGAQDRTVSRYTTRHRANLTIDTRTQTAYGTLRTYHQHQRRSRGRHGRRSERTARSSSGVASPSVARSSFADHEGSLGDGGMRSLYTGLVDATTGADGINQIAYTWQLGNGITLNVGADEPRVELDRQPVGDRQSHGRHRSDQQPRTATRIPIRGWRCASARPGDVRASRCIGHQNQATYYTAATPASRLHGASTGTTLCDYPDDKWGWAVLGGAEIKLDMLSPGSRVGFYGTYGVGASRITREQPDEPGPVRLRQPGRVRRPHRRGLRQRRQPGADHLVDGRRRLRVLLDPQLLEHDLRRLHRGRATTAPSSTAAGSAAAAAALPSSVVRGGTTCDPSFNFWTSRHAPRLVPGLPGLRLAVDVLYTASSRRSTAQTVTLGKAQGARPTGVYTAKNLGITSVMFRAQRTWGGGD